MAPAAVSKQRARILVVDDHPMLREGLIRLIEQQGDLMCCGEAGTVAETQAAVARHRPDLVILDLRLKDGDGLELIKSLKSQFPDLRIVILSQFEAALYAERALRAGAKGYVCKEEPAEELMAAIRSVLNGNLYVGRRLAGQDLLRIQQQPSAHAQQIVLAMIAFVHHHYSRPMNLAVVAADLKMNAAYLSDLFSRTQGVGFHRFLEEVRLEKARELLKDPRNRVCEVACAVGYASADQFRHAFKAHAGVPPSTWRQGNRLPAPVLNPKPGMGSAGLTKTPR